MTDRELLEKAAKAAGIELNGAALGTMYMEDGQWVMWNPLTDDGDALRLAVNLEISLWQAGDYAVADHDALGPKMREPYNGEPYAATRRAIVRAAAAIGEAA